EWSDSSIRIPLRHALLRMLESKGPPANYKCSWSGFDIRYPPRREFVKRMSNPLHEIEPERFAFTRRLPTADRLDRRAHAAVWPEQPVGQRDNADVGKCRRRRLAQGLRDRQFLAHWVERANGHEGGRRRATDAGVTVHDHGG